MSRIAAGLVIAGLVLMPGVTPSWGGPPNPTRSDANGNTAGGTGALQDVDVPRHPDPDNLLDFGLNTGFGYSALSHHLGFSGEANTAIGGYALQFNTGVDNTAIGAHALRSNTTGNYNTASGKAALISNSTGKSNTASGEAALLHNSTGNSNTASGKEALEQNTTGSENAAFGRNALQRSTGNQNIAVGSQAGASLVSGNKNIYLGHPGATSESRTMRLGNVQTQTFIAGVNTTAVTGAPVLIDAQGQLGTQLSSARYKRDIETMGARSEGVLRLRPVTFVYTHDREGMRQYGLLAEDVVTVYPELVTRSAKGELQAVRYQELIPMLVNELQRQQQVTEHLRQELSELRSVVGHLRGVAQR